MSTNFATLTDAKIETGVRAISADELLHRRLNLSEAQISVLLALTKQLPVINSLLENSFNDLSSTFVEMSADIMDFQQHIKTLSDLNTDDDVIVEMSRESTEVSARISENLTKVIMGMQFQDRVSQNLVIAINVLKEIAAELDQYSKDICITLGHENTITPDADTITMFSEILKLGEVKQLFLDFLKERGHGELVEKIGGGFHGHTADEEDVELF
jgi:hypothetical protein